MFACVCVCVFMHFMGLCLRCLPAHKSALVGSRGPGAPDLTGGGEGAEGLKASQMRGLVAEGSGKGGLRWNEF